MKVLLTGSTGFVGSALLIRLSKEGYGVRTSVRKLSSLLSVGAEKFTIEDINRSTNWIDALNGVQAVIHCAARVHVMKDDAVDPLAAYREVNVGGTLNLARQAAQAGVQRFLFLSSIKVNGEATSLGEPFTADDVPNPEDSYGVSKLEAEQGLREIEAQTGMEVVIVRPPLVYGPGVKANFAGVLRWVSKGIPLPLGAIQNARSLVALDNLVDLLVTCLNHPAAAGQTFLVSDGQDVSTTELLRRIAHVMHKKIYLIPVPASWLELGALLIGKRSVANRLCGSLQVDIEKTRRLLGWRPPLTLDQGILKAVEGMK